MKKIFEEFEVNEDLLTFTFDYNIERTYATFGRRASLHPDFIDDINSKIQRIENSLEANRKFISEHPEYSVSLSLEGEAKGSLLKGDEVVASGTVGSTIEEFIMGNMMAYVLSSKSPLFQPETLKKLQEKLILDQLVQYIP